MTTLTRNRKSGFYIEVTCPGCGGKLELDDDFFVLQCTHCGSVHRVLKPDVPVTYLIPAKVDQREARFSIDRFLKRRSLPLTGSGMHLKKLYYPYWKVDAILFRLRNKVYEKVVCEETEYNDAVTVTQDRTEIGLSPYTATLAAGPHFDGIPESIGMRAEYIKMAPYAVENIQEGFDSLAVMASWEKVRNDLLFNMGSIADIAQADFGSNVTELFHPKASLVYFPFLVFESYSGAGFSRYVVDGVAGRVLDHVTDIETDQAEDYGESPYIEFGALTVEHHRCLSCGVDLPPEQSYVYICANCHELTLIGSGGGEIDTIYLAEAPKNPADRMFPFWCLKIRGKSGAGVKKMFGGIHSSDQIVIPAFKLGNFDTLFNLAKRTSAAIPKMLLEPVESLDSRFVSVGIGLDEALMLTEVVMFRQSFSQQSHKGPNRKAFVPSEVKLVYLPFHPENYFMVDSALNAITFAKTLVP